ncbi:hypothetical protein KKZ80_14400 [Enterobacter kobei]|uniref:hypothetical protein n=1 Tax=Enterobacter kobei TaxID=208224 RepID=UPI001BE06699|nr:hypothetical protein [Enterobacter kobei]MBT1907242.1 hypothetical protein [Enterobacter kobei]
MSVKRYSIGYKDSASGRYAAMLDKQDGGYVSHEDYAALESRCAALAAENGVLLAIMNEQAGSFGAALAEGFHDAVMESGIDQLIDIYQRRLQQAIQCIPTTTSTDAFLAEVRSSAVDEVCLKISNAIINCSQDEQVGLDAAATICGDFASEIRKGVQS